MARIHGAASASEAVSGNLNFYTMYITEKVNAVPGVDIDATGDILDQTQQNLDDIVNIIKGYSIECGVISTGDNWVRYKVSEQIYSQVNNFKFVMQK